MNGIHDMGGMHGLGPIKAEKTEGSVANRFDEVW